MVEKWQWHTFEEISGALMHEIMAIRQEVFIVEQQCIYLDADQYDRVSLHLTGRDREGRIIVYLRLSDPGSRFATPSIGRVLTVPKSRGKGLAKEAVNRAIQRCREDYSSTQMKVSAQQYLKDFYADFGFVVSGPPYDEDGIVHTDMVLDIIA